MPAAVLARLRTPQLLQPTVRARRETTVSGIANIRRRQGPCRHAPWATTYQRAAPCSLGTGGRARRAAFDCVVPTAQSGCYLRPSPVPETTIPNFVAS